MEITSKWSNVKLNVKPVFIDFTHEYVYEGPCRFGRGDSLTPEYDMMASSEIYKGFLQGLSESMPECAHLMEPVRIKSYTDAFNVISSDMDILLAPDETDVYILTGSGRATQVDIEFARRCRKPIIFYNEVLFAVSTEVAALRARQIETYALYDMNDAPKILKALYVRKVLENTRALILNRFGTDCSPVSAQDGFLSLEAVKDKLGINFNVMDVHEYLDQLTVRPADENPTLPGRKMQNINEQDMTEIEKIADDLISGANECEIDREYVCNSVKAYYLTKKLLEHRQCNAFSAPCPDMCSTRRLNQEKCTLCLTHSLLEEEGIPSACEIDLNILVCKVILEALTGRSTYMGNTCWLKMKDGKLTAPDFSSVTEEEYSYIRDVPDLMATLHSVPNRKLKGYDAPDEEYSLRSFAFSGWGATMRYDFTKDMDQPVTVVRIDPKCEKMLVIRGKIKGQFGYRRQNCSAAVVYQVENAKEAYEKTFDFGSHMALVYGDYSEELAQVCRVLNLEMILE